MMLPLSEWQEASISAFKWQSEESSEGEPFVPQLRGGAFVFVGNGSLTLTDYVDYRDSTTIPIDLTLEAGQGCFMVPGAQLPWTASAGTELFTIGLNDPAVLAPESSELHVLSLGGWGDSSRAMLHEWFEHIPWTATALPGLFRRKLGQGPKQGWASLYQACRPLDLGPLVYKGGAVIVVLQEGFQFDQQSFNAGDLLIVPPGWEGSPQFSEGGAVMAFWPKSCQLAKAQRHRILP